MELPLSDHSVIFAKLDLNSNKIQECLPTNSEFVSPILGNLSSLLFKASFFSISHNNLIGKIPFSNCNASNLEFLILSNNQLSGTIPTCLDSRNLRVLNFESNKLDVPIPLIFRSGCGLHALKLNRNMLQGQVPRSLAYCKELEVLDIGVNQLNDTFPYWLENLSKLQVLVMRSNNFDGILPLQYILHWKAMMKDVNNSRLHYVSFQGSEYYYQDTVAIVLKGIYIEMGQIPSSLENLRELESLNLSRNALSGQIPSQLTSLTSLAILDLSDNNLTGSIPQGNQFNTFPNTSYKGNIGLCGFPLSRKCGTTDGALSPMLTLQQEEDSTCLLDWKFVIAGYCSDLTI
ncbi:receptor-like protein Cf-9 homolog [Macadamia integrifolia]|uniref:receptor-like protein Cf-9 homolog n=1 Tax=Macadamia integrifolia TaxID=60698 RepID=UPI001C4EA992|nr:receptor-like protein Cf-9 homolog [Macadamia integrifolia]